jgi:hypothetical protein
MHWREALFIETALNPERGNDLPARNRGRAVVTDRFKYMVWPWGKQREHLVDLATDPGEMVNLAVSDRYRDVVIAMRQRLSDWCQSTGDTFAVPGHVTLSPAAGQQELEAISRGTRWLWQKNMTRQEES